MDWGRIAVGCRMGGAPDPMFVSSLMKLRNLGMRTGDIMMEPTIELPHHYAAECMVASFVKTGADTLLMLDDDMVFDPADLGNLRNDKDGWGYDMLGALYQSRKPPHQPLCIIHDEKSPTGFANMVTPPANSIVTAGVVGLGFTLLRRSIVDKIQAQKPRNELMFYWGITGDSEDANFCRRVEAAGGKIGISTRVSVGHRMGVVLRWDAEACGTRLYTRGMKEEQEQREKAERAAGNGT